MTDDTRRIVVTYVTAPACHLCDQGREVLADLATSYPLDVREVALTDPEGLHALAASRAPFPPVLLFDGRPVAHGRLSAGQLARELDRLSSSVGAGGGDDPALAEVTVDPGRPTVPPRFGGPRSARPAGGG